MGQKAFRGRVRVVRHHGRIPDEPGSILLLGHLHEVLNGFQGDPSDFQPGIAMSVAAGHSMRESASRVVVLPPLATLEAQVALVAKQSGQGGRLFQERRQPFTPGAVGVVPVELGRRQAWRPGRIVANDAVLVGVSACDQRGEAGATQARRHVAARKTERTGRQTVEVGCTDRRVTHEAVVRPSLVVGDDEQDVGPLWSRRSPGLGACRQEPTEEE